MHRTVQLEAVGGTTQQCDATFTVDMNAFAAGQLGGNPKAYLAVPGTDVNCQWWGRDTFAHGFFQIDELAVPHQNECGAPARPVRGGVGVDDDHAVFILSDDVVFMEMGAGGAEGVAFLESLAGCFVWFIWDDFAVLGDYLLWFGTYGGGDVHDGLHGGSAGLCYR